jgi:hypothetical protein
MGHPAPGYLPIPFDVLSFVGLEQSNGSMLCEVKELAVMPTPFS